MTLTKIHVTLSNDHALDDPISIDTIGQTIKHEVFLHGALQGCFVDFLPRRELVGEPEHCGFIVETSRVTIEKITTILEARSEIENATHIGPVNTSATQ